jgi:hypothetical protein
VAYSCERKERAGQRGSGGLEQTLEQGARFHVERINKPEERRKANLAFASFDAAHLNCRKAGLGGEVLLSPATSKPRRAYVLPEPLDSIHSRPSSAD